MQVVASDEDACNQNGKPVHPFQALTKFYKFTNFTKS